MNLFVAVDLLPRLLLPLAGPTPDTFDEEDVDKLPIDLQYLDEDKKVEEDADIRKLILESLLQVWQLCNNNTFLWYVKLFFFQSVIKKLNSDDGRRTKIIKN